MSDVTPSARIPTYRRHRPSGQAVVTLNGRDVYLGKWNTKASRTEYDRLVAEWIASGRRFTSRTAAPDRTVAEVALAYLKHAKGYYAPGPYLNTIKAALRPMRTLYGRTPAGDFGPLAFQVIQRHWIDEGYCRNQVNKLTGIGKRVFKWAVSQELVPPSAYHGIATVPGLRKGHSAARETTPVGPVDDTVVEATLPYLPPVVADMVRLQRLTGCRPGEMCDLRPADVDQSGDVWRYVPIKHKTAHHGRGRVILMGPKAQAILTPYLLRPAGRCCFSPLDSERRRRDDRHAARQTPLSCGNRPGTNRTRKPKKKAGDRYDAHAYAHAVRCGIDKANRVIQRRLKAEGREATAADLLPRWSPNRLRHTAATEIRRQFGLEAAQVTLGHAQANVTQIYAERDEAKAAEVMRLLG